MNAKNSYVLVRTYSAGVHAGELVERNGKEVTLKNARRIWSWKGANTLHEIAVSGLSPDSRVSCAVSSIILIEAIEVIAAEEACAESLKKAAERW